MKDSGIDWCREIPVSWETKPSKYIMHKRKDICSHYNDEDILSLTMQGVIVRDLNAGGKMPTTFDGYQIVEPGNLLMCLFDYDVTPRCIGLISNKGLTSPAYSQFVLKNNNCAKYYYYYYLMIDNTKELLHLAKNLRHSFTEEQIGVIKVPVPPIAEQERISDFLDEKCAEIDQLSEDIRKQINILEDYKKSVITRAVTKGLDLNAEMEESGVDYLGKYPTNWKLSRVKFNLSEPMKYGATESGVEYSEELPRYIRITDITSNNKLKEDGKLSLTWQQAKGYILSQDTILFARSGGTVGKTFYYKPSYGKAAFAGYLISAIPNEKKMLTEWLYFYTLSNTYWEWANQIFTQATIQNIGADKYSNLPITIPDIETQKTIILYLTDKCSEIDSSITLKRNQLDKLATYKKSIIYEYVTGKKRVA